MLIIKLDPLRLIGNFRHVYSFQENKMIYLQIYLIIGVFFAGFLTHYITYKNCTDTTWIEWLLTSFILIVFIVSSILLYPLFLKYYYESKDF